MEGGVQTPPPRRGGGGAFGPLVWGGGAWGLCIFHGGKSRGPAGRGLTSGNNQGGTKPRGLNMCLGGQKSKFQHIIDIQ